MTGPSTGSHSWRPRASVVVPAHNAAAHLGQCLEALSGQTARDIEVLVVDDGSTDSTGRIAARAAAHDQRIRVITQDNAGVSAARNTGLDAACGQWLLFVDADDVVAPDYVERLLDLGQEPGCDLPVVGLRPFWDCPGGFADPSVRTIRVFDRDEALIALMGPCRGFLWNKAYRAEIVRRHGLRMPEGIRQSEDMLFNLAYLGHVRRVILDPGCRYGYRQHASSATNLLGQRHWFDVLPVFEAFRRAAGTGPERMAVARGYLPVAYEALYRYDRLGAADPELRDRVEDMRSYCERALIGAPIAYRLKMGLNRHAMGLVLRRRRGGLRWIRR